MKRKSSLAHKAGTALRKATPTILTCISAAGVVATAVLTAKATPKALKCIEAAKDAKSAKTGGKLTRMETIGACWQCYAPAAVTGIATIGCIFSANVLNRRQQAALTSAYALVNRQFRDYKNKVKELYGQEAHERIMSSLAVEKPEAPRIYGAMSGKDFDFEGVNDEPHLFYDAFSEQYFQATIPQVLLAEYHTNRNFQLMGGEIPLEQFYTFLGLDTPNELKGLSWFVSDYYTWIDFTHTKAMIDDGINGEVECWIIEMEYPPTMEPLDY